MRVIAHQARNTIATLTLTAAGYGIALLPCTLMHNKMAGIIYRDISDFPEQMAMNVYYRKDEVNPVVKSFFQVVSDTDLSSFYK